MMSCCSRTVSLLKRSMTLFASLSWLLWASIASTRLLVRPSWRKKTRCPTPQSGAVRNSSGPAPPSGLSQTSGFCRFTEPKAGSTGSQCRVYPIAECRAKRKIPETIQALEGHCMSDHRRQMIRYRLKHLELLEELIGEIDRAIVSKRRRVTSTIAGGSAFTRSTDVYRRRKRTIGDSHFSEATVAVSGEFV